MSCSWLSINMQEEYSHESCLDVLVYFLKLLRHIQWGMCSQVLLRSPGVLPEVFKRYSIRSIHMSHLSISWPTFWAFEKYSIRNVIISPPRISWSTVRSIAEYAHQSSLDLQKYFSCKITAPIHSDRHLYTIYIYIYIYIYIHMHASRSPSRSLSLSLAHSYL